ncbi:hypothetical protein BDR26DRAFT_874523 [Obelidium mucronatum]|nr:hypothetical protein BDR26DRAFT_874523 [Obelidium mucronatum]
MNRNLKVPMLTPDALFPLDHRRSLTPATSSAASASSTSTASSSLAQQSISKLKQLVATLDVSRITDRVIACGLPWQKPSDPKNHRNNVRDLGLFLKGRYRDRFMVFNLTGDTSLGNYDSSFLGHQVVSFGLSKAYQLSLKTLFDISRAMHAWISLHPENVCIVHCTNGVGRTGLAVAAYLRFSDTFSDASTAFEYFISRRTPTDQTWPSVSMRRYIQYINNTILVNGSLPTQYPLLLDCIVLNSIPDFDDYGSCRPGIELYQNRKLVYSRVYSRFTDGQQGEGGIGISVDEENDSVVFQFSDPETGDGALLLDRDIQLRIFHCADADDGVSEATQVVTMVNFSFHTGFMPAGFIRVAARDLDLSRRDVEEGRFGAGFSMDLVFDESTGIKYTAKGEEEKAISYTKNLDKNQNKCLARLISYHIVKVDERMMKGLEGMGISRLFACIALQKTNNDIKMAYDYYKSVLAPPPPPAPSPPPPRAISPPSSITTNEAPSTRRPPPTVADLRQQTQRGQSLNRDRSPSQNMRNLPPPPAILSRKQSNASSDGGFGSDTSSTTSGVRNSIQRLENLLQKSADIASHHQHQPSSSHRPRPPRTAMTEEDRAAEDLLNQLKERRARMGSNDPHPGGVRMQQTTSAPSSGLRNITTVNATNRPRESSLSDSTSPRLYSEPPGSLHAQKTIPAVSNPELPQLEEFDLDYLDMYSDLIPKSATPEPPKQQPSSVNHTQANVIPQTATSTPAPPPPPPEPSDSLLANELTSKSQSLTKLRESETKRKSVALKKRQTLHWKDIENDALDLAPDQQPSGNAAQSKRKTLGRDGKEVQVKKFEELFCFVPSTEKGSSKLVQKAQFTTLLDFRRANVIAIGMSRFTRRNLTGSQLAGFVNNLDTTKITVEDLIQMKQLIPTEYEAQILNDYHNSPRPATALPLAPAETFMIDLIRSDLDIGQHVDAFLFLLQLPQESQDIISNLTAMTQMCTQLQTSSDLKVILRTVYQLGQMTNQDLGGGNASFRPWMGKEAKAIGFRLDGLARLKDVKSADGNWSLMSLLVDLVNKNRPDVLDFTLKFHNLKRIRQIDLRALMAHLINLETTLATLQNYRYKNPQFLALLKPRLTQSHTDLTTLRTHFTILHSAWLETCAYFAEDPEEYIPIPELFAIVQQNPDPNFHIKTANTVVDDTRKPVTHIFTAMHVFLFGFEDSVKENRRKVEEEAKRLIREARENEERRRREEARAIKEGRIPAPVPVKRPSPLSPNIPDSMGSPVGGSFGSLNDEDVGMSSTSSRNVNAMKNRASMMLLQRKEGEAQEMLQRFNTLTRTTIMTDQELQERAETLEDEFVMAEDDDGAGSEAGNSSSNGYAGSDGYAKENHRDSFQSVMSAYPTAGGGASGGDGGALETPDGRKICQECFIPADECYCNW